ncbi:MAG TPA: hypothetical protein VER33_25105 [Polyangiaceae bacterium]|nr:hypothetical protein [Polyangiaceae bacterium]
MPVHRDAAGAIVDQREHLRIIDAELWTAVQERLAAVRRFYTRTADGKPKGRSLPTGRSRYLFSSLLCCAGCGGKMVISGGSRELTIAARVTRNAASARTAYPSASVVVLASSTS